MQNAELWDLYDENKKLIGKDHVRGDKLPVGCYHLVVHVWIRNTKGEYLISQRAANRAKNPLLWECVGGSVLKGEDSLSAAIRESKEEVGVDLLPQKGALLFSVLRKSLDDIVDVWLFEYDGSVNLDNATTDEVAQVEWMGKGQIKKLSDSKKLVHTLGYFFDETKGM